MNKRALKVLAIFAAAGVGFCGIAVAGLKGTNSETVLIYGSGLRVHGALGVVRNSTSPTEFIGCKVSAGTSGSTVSCSAQDSVGATFDCSSSNANLVNAALGISGDSWVNVNRDTTGTCTFIAVENSSVHQPKAP
jgi:hypothetical protein